MSAALIVTPFVYSAGWMAAGISLPAGLVIISFSAPGAARSSIPYGSPQRFIV